MERKYGPGGRTALHRAAANDAVKVAKMLIDAGANVNAIDRDGAMPLHWAAGNNALGVAKNFSLMQEQIWNGKRGVVAHLLILQLGEMRRM